MLKRGHPSASHHVRNIAECALAFSSGLRGDEPFPSEAPMREALSLLDRKFVVAVAGDTGVGKSSVLDLLAGRSLFSRTSTPALCRRWAYAPGRYEEEGVESRYYPCDMLQSVELLDTKGVDAVDSPVPLVGILSRAEVLVYVIDARNPQGIGSWRFLAQLPSECYARMVIAVTHEDHFDYEAQQDIKTFIRKQSDLHFGVEIPLYMLRSGGEFKGQGAEALARRINSMLDLHAMHEGWDERLLAVTKNLLSEQKQVLHNQDMLSRLDSGFMTAIEHEIDFMQGQIDKVLPARLQAISKFVQDCVPMLARKTSRQLGYYLSIRHLSRLHNMPFYIDSWFYEYIRKGIEEQHEYHNREFLAACEQHWDAVRPRVKDQLDCEIGPFPAEDLKEKVDAYRRRLGRAIYPALADFGLKPCLIRLYAGQKGWLKRHLVVVLLLIVMAGCLGGLGESTAGVILLICAVGVWLLSSFALFFVRMKMSSQIVAAAEDIHLAMQGGLGVPLYEATMSAVADYRKLYTTIRGHVAIHAEQVAPLMAEHNKLFYRMSALSRHRQGMREEGEGATSG